MTITQHRVPDATVAVKIDQTPEAKGQNITAQRCVLVNGEHMLRLVANIDSSYPGQSRIYVDLWTNQSWSRVWSYRAREFDLPNAYSAKDAARLPELLLPVYDRMIIDALLIVGE